MMVGMNIVHFLGVQSMIMSVDMQYNSQIILVGELISATCLYITYYILAHYHQKRWTILVSTLLIGIGISGFHLIAMKAVKLVHNPNTFDLDDMIQFTPFTYSLSPDTLLVRCDCINNH
jgi:NO-binding membrane sensor protein with MHYT domain